MMETQSMINIGLSALMGVIGWFARQLWEAVDELRRDLKGIEVAMPTNYVRKDEFSDAVRDLRHDIDIGFQRIYDKIDGKADK